MLFRAFQHRIRASREQLFERLVLVAVVLASVVAISPNVADPDLWGHVQYGRDLLREGLPTRATYSYVAQDQPWVNHENLMEVALAVGADWLGPRGLIMAKLMAGLALMLVVLRTCQKQGAGLLATCLILLLTASGVAHYWSLRPQLFSFAAYAALLGLLAWCFEGWGEEDRDKGNGKREKEEGGETSRPARVPNLLFPFPFSPFPTPPFPFSLFPFPLFVPASRLRWLWLVPLLMAAWTNAHGGFLAGGAIFIAYLVMRGLEAYCQGGVRAIGLLKRFALMIAGAVTATLINPYGYHYHLWLYDDLHVPRPEIIEWLPPSFSDPHSIPLLLLVVASVAALALTRRSRDATHLVILAATLWQALEHQRHIPFFALSVAFFLPLHFESALTRWGKREKGPEKGEKGNADVGGLAVQSPAVSPFPIPLLLCILPLLLVFALLTYKLCERASDLKVLREDFPVSAVAFVGEHQLRGRVLCTFNWAQYVLAAFPADADQSPRLLVHVDGRCRTAYSQAMLDEHFDFLFGEQPASQRYRDPQSPLDVTRALENGYPNLALIDRRQPHSVAVMHSQSKKWVLLYQDSLAQLWGRRERYDDPRSPDFVNLSERRVGDEPQLGHVTWPALPR